MASWSLKSYEELGISDVTVKLIIGDTLNKGMDKGAHMKVLRNCMEPDIQINGEIFHVVI